MRHLDGACCIGIVEDDTQYLELLQSQLEQLGYRHHFCADDAASALRLIEAHSPFVLLISADFGDGPLAVRIAEQVRSRWDVPCVFLTRRLDDPTLRRCRSAAPAGYLVKPVAHEALRAQLDTLAQRSRLKREVQQREQQRLRAEQRFEDALSNVPLAVLLIAEDGRVRQVNRGAESLFLRPREELLGARIEDLLQPTMDGALISAEANCVALLRDGQRVAAQVHSVNVRCESETIVAHFVYDARPRVALHRLLFNAPNATALTQLTDTLAHDLNNLLGALQTLQFLLAEGVQNPQAQLHELEHAIERGSLLTEQLAQLSRWDDCEVQALDLERQLELLVPLLRRVLGDGATLEVTLQGPAACRIAPAQLQYVLFALLANAREAMSTGGKVSLELSSESTSPAHAVVSITDTGMGMTPAQVARAFDPFFTTKRGHEGLGLASARRMIEQIGGSVFLASRPGAGTQVIISLPLL